jgi:hypothetical protein
MSCQIGVNPFFGANNFIKFLNSDIVAVEGPNTIERMIAGDIRIPYAQVLKGRIILKAGQTGYLMNNLGLGDNATFVAIIARYDAKSVNEEDNYLEYYYMDDLSTLRYMDQLMILTGNSAKRIPQLYFNNPNSTYKVTLDIMIAVIDDEYTFFTDTTNQSGTSFFGLQCNANVSNIETFITDESIIIYSNTSPRNPLIYLVLQDISSLHRTGSIIVVDENTSGRLYLEFISDADAMQAFSLLNYVSNNEGVIIQDLNPIIDIYTPVSYFYQYLGNVPSASYIEFNGATAAAYDTSYGFTFSTVIDFSSYGTVVDSILTLTKTDLNALIIATTSDNRDGTLILTDTNTILKDYASAVVDTIILAGTYSMSFNVSDIAGNSIDTNKKIILSII